MSDKKIWEALESVRVDDIVRARPGGLGKSRAQHNCYSIFIREQQDA
jgi:hypothetical protein